MASGGTLQRRLALPEFDWRVLLGLAAYGAAFMFLHDLAAVWGRGVVFSFWFPAAGLRFALLWHLGRQATVPVALAELAAYVVVGRVGFTHVDDLVFVLSVLIPPLLYGAVIAAAQGRLRTESRIEVGGFAWTFASIVAPILVGTAAISWAVLLRTEPYVDTLAEAIRTAAVFSLGDLLGVLLLGPPLSWALRRELPLFRHAVSRAAGVFEAAGAFIVAWVLTGLMLYAGLGLRLVPVMLAVVWIGLRTGHAATWLAVLASAIVMLPLTAYEESDAARFAAHLTLAATALVGNLVGGFADAQALLKEQLARRNRLLYQADRLKSLRAMSAAVIHEIGQPLSIISIEAKHLAAAAKGNIDKAELAQSAALVDRKVTGLVELIKRLRRFGETARGEAGLIAVEDLVREALSIARIELTSRAIRFDISVPEGLWIKGEMLELQQALLNLLRNAAQHSDNGQIRVSAGKLPSRDVFIDVENAVGAQPRRIGGMGIGLLVTTSIIEAFGGALTREQVGQHFRFRMTFPGVPNV